MALLFLYREAGIQKEGSLFGGVGAVNHHKSRHRAHHTAYSRQASFGIDLNIHKKPGKACYFFLQFAYSLDHGIGSRHPLSQGGYLCFHTGRSRRQSRHAHFHTDIPDARSFLKLVHRPDDLPDGSPPHPFQTAFPDNLIYNPGINRNIFPHVYNFINKKGSMILLPCIFLSLS